MAYHTPQAVPTQVGRSYTKGRRQPFLLRKVPGAKWTLPFGPYTVQQAVFGAGALVVLLYTHRIWAVFGGFNLLIGIGVPIALMFGLRRARIEGRGPLRTAAAAVAYLVAPRRGHLAGRAWRPARPVTVRDHHVVVAGLPPGAAGPVAARARPAPAQASLAQLMASGEVS